MDRKSFFKRTLFAIGAAIVPNAILKAIPKEKERQYGFREFEVDYTPYQNGAMPLFQQMQEAFGNNNRAVKANESYWVEYEQKYEHGHFEWVGDHIEIIE